MKRALVIIAACIAGGYAGFCVGFIALSVDAAWEGILQTGYEAELGVIIGIFYACIAGALGGVVGIGRFGAYLGSLGLGAFLLWVGWCFFHFLPRWGLDLAGTVGWLIILTDIALAGALGVAISKRMTSSPRLQFSRKTLFLLVTMCAAALSLIGVREQLRQQWRERKVTATRREQWQVLAKLQHFRCFPEWGEGEYERHVVGLRLVAIPPVQDNELSDDLAHLKELERLGGRSALSSSSHGVR